MTMSADISVKNVTSATDAPAHRLTCACGHPADWHATTFVDGQGWHRGCSATGCDCLRNAVHLYAAECERLAAQLRDAHDGTAADLENIRNLMTERDTLMAENARLRDALEEVAWLQESHEGSYTIAYDMRCIARRALSPETDDA